MKTKEEKKEYHRIYYLKNKNIIIERSKNRVDNNREQVLAQRAEFRKNNKEKLKEQQKEHYLNNKEKRNAKSREYSKKNYDKVVIQVKKYQKENPEKVKAWRFNTKSKRRMRINNTIIPFTSEQLNDRLSVYDNKCWMCGNNAQEIDHVIPLARGGAHMLSNLRPACTHCNRQKSYKKHTEFQAFKIA